MERKPKNTDQSGLDIDLAILLTMSGALVFVLLFDFGATVCAPCPGRGKTLNVLSELGCG